MNLPTHTYKGDKKMWELKTTLLYTTFVTLIFDNTLTFENSEAITLDNALEVAKKNMKTYGFYHCLCLDSKTGEILFKVDFQKEEY
jgi:hypothetical protein